MNALTDIDIKNLKYIPVKLAAVKNTCLAAVIINVLTESRDSIRKYEYEVNGCKWVVYDSPTFKITRNVTDDSYNCFFSKKTGLNVRFGKEVEDDPAYCELGPEIADIEVVAGKCPKINGKNCAFCYKNNGGEIANCMTLKQFKELIGFMPKNLSQIAFGITGVKTNPEFFDMMQYAKDVGVVSNYTTNGVDLDDECIEKTLDLCGRIAVSCYEGAKEICYDTMDRVGKAAAKRNMKFPCNIHLVLSKATFGHVKDVLNDAKEKKIPNLGAIVILRIKPVGRASNLDCVIPKEYYKEIVDFCLTNNIKFGFDSCGAKAVEDVLVEAGHADLTDCIESCESSRLSSYFNWKREYWSCSFCENNHKIMDAIDPFKFKDFPSFWNSDEVKRLRFPAKMACKSCPWYCLD